MNDKKFKIGDRVRIIDARSIELYELNEIGTIVRIDNYDGNDCGPYVVDMGRPRRPDIGADNDTCWWLNEKHIELVSKPNQQLEFAFMYE